MKQTKLKIGDNVKVIHYGHPLCFYDKSMIPTNSVILQESTECTWIDFNPSIVGKYGVIRDISNNQYALYGIPEKSAWYDRQQLELIK